MSEPNQENIDACCVEFESAWKAGQQPEIETFLERVTVEQQAELLKELIQVELWWRRDEVPPPNEESYLQRFSNFAEIIQAVFAEYATPTIVPGEKQSQPTLPNSVGPYKILQQIGSGGMGQVYMAEQSEPVKRRVALKLIRNAGPSKEVLARFEAERQALAMMDHQNIAKVLDAGVTEEGLPYFAMELVKGVPITEYCDSNKLTLNERLDLFVQTCRAIQHAHQKGIIHRDIKPSNVLVTLYDGKPVAKVIDFGLAKALQEHSRLTDKTLFTQFGQVVGTLAYMSPEQAEMNALDVDTRTDVYSLGVILYELLTGSTPISRERIRTEALDRILAIIREGETPRPSTRLSESGDAITGISEQRRTEPRKLSLILRGDLDWIAVKALEKDRTRRYDTPSALADDVQRFINNDAVEARPPSMGYRFQKVLRKHKAKFAAATTILVLLVAGIISTTTMYFRARSAEITAKQRVNEAQAAEQKMRIAKDEAYIAVRQAAKSEARVQFQLANARWNASRTWEARHLLQEITPEFQNFEWNFCNRLFQGSDITLYGHVNDVNSVCFSPDGKIVASGSSDNTVILWNSTTGRQLHILRRHSGPVNCVTISQDGFYIASGSSDHTVHVSDLKTGVHGRELHGHMSPVNSIAFSPNGRQIASGSADNTVKLWDWVSGAEIATLKHTAAVSSVCYSPDGSTIATKSGHVITLWNVQTHNRTKTLVNRTRGNNLPSPSPNIGKTRDNTIGEATDRIRRNNDTGINVCFSHDGTNLVCAGKESTVQVWDVDSAKPIRTLEGHDSFVTSVCFSPDGRWIASGGLNIKIWDAHTGDLSATLRGHTSYVKSLCFSQDCSRLISSSSDNTVKIWSTITDELEPGSRKIITGQQAMPIIAPRGMSAPMDCVCSSSDGTRIVTLEGNRTWKVWDSLKGEEVSVLTGLDSSTKSVSLSPDGKLLVSGGVDSLVRVWNVFTGDEVASLPGHRSSVTEVCFSQDGTKLASADSAGSVKIWDVPLKKEVNTVNQNDGEVGCLCLSPDNSLIAAACGRKVSVYRVSSSELVAQCEGHRSRVRSICFSPNGNQIASASDDSTIRVWDSIGGNEITVLSGHNSPVSSVCFSSDGSRILSGSTDKVVKIWNSITGEEIVQLELPRSFRVGVLHLCFSGDGAQVVAVPARASQAVSIWNLRSEIRTLSGHQGNVLVARFSPDGTRVASGSSDKTVKIWDTETGTEVFTLEGHSDAVTDLHFSADNTQLLSKSKQERIVWNVQSGKSAFAGPWLEQTFGGRTSPDGRWLAIPSVDKVYLVDQNFKDTPSEKSYREAKASPKPWMHNDLFFASMTQGDFLAAAIHAGWLLNIDARSSLARTSFEAAWEKLDDTERAMLPASIRAVKTLPRPDSSQVP